jgi:endonuclease-3
MAVTAAAKRRAAEIARRLAALYPDAECALEFRSPLELLVAVILSAQCTDARVNIVTRELFKRYRTAQDYADAPLAELEQAIRSTGFYRNKAKNIQGCCRKLVERHGGKVPRDFAALVELDGVGRKTANVVMGVAFEVPSGVVVDTHVTRLSQRLDLTRETDAVKIERKLAELLPSDEWIGFSHRLIWHGRRVCVARKPRCAECALESLCPKVGVKPAAKNKSSQASSRPPRLATATAVARSRR